VTNTGNVTVSGLAINDMTIGVSNLAVTPSTLLPGESGTATATYTITLTDMNNGSITNTALASGTDPNGDPVTDDSDTGTDPDGNTIDNPELVDSDGDGDPGNDPTVTNLNQDPQISLVKSASVGGTGNVGDQITYTFVVTNTGNVTVSGLAINDMTIGVSNLAVTPSTLLPGESGTATATYTITLTDMNNGSITNTALASGTDPNGDPVTDTSDTGTDPDGNTDRQP
jgi:large repetitive protein